MLAESRVIRNHVIATILGFAIGLWVADYNVLRSFDGLAEKIIPNQHNLSPETQERLEQIRADQGDAAVRQTLLNAAEASVARMRSMSFRERFRGYWKAYLFFGFFGLGVANMFATSGGTASRAASTEKRSSQDIHVTDP